MTLVIDASVVVNVWLPEPFGTAANRWLSLPDVKIAPEFLRIEVANAIWKYENAGLMNRRQTDRAWHSLLESDLRFLPDADYLDQARLLARNLAHPIYDCLYVALAETHQAKVVTADRRLHGLCRDNPNVVAGFWIEDDPASD